MEVLQKFKQRKFYTYRVSCLLSCLLLVLSSGFLSVSADTVNNDNVYWVTDIGTPVKFPQYGLVNFNYTYTGAWNETSLNGMVINENLTGHSVYCSLNNGGAIPTDSSVKYKFTEANFSCSNVPKKGKLVIVGGFATLSRDNSNRVSVNNYGGDFSQIDVKFYSETGYYYTSHTTTFKYLDAYRIIAVIDYDLTSYPNASMLNSVGIRLFSTEKATGTYNFHYYGVVLSSYIIADDVSDADTIIGAINNQTDTLLQEPDNSQFSSDKINGQVDSIQDKMGVLSFGETVLSDFVDLWTVTGSTELTFPAFTINVANVDYQVWGNQTFNLNRLDGWFGSFMSVVRRVLSCIVWIACLNYIIKQFEVFFSNG